MKPLLVFGLLLLIAAVAVGGTPNVPDYPDGYVLPTTSGSADGGVADPNRAQHCNYANEDTFPLYVHLVEQRYDTEKDVELTYAWDLTFFFDYYHELVTADVSLTAEFWNETDNEIQAHKERNAFVEDGYVTVGSWPYYGTTPNSESGTLRKFVSLTPNRSPTMWAHGVTSTYYHYPTGTYNEWVVDRIYIADTVLDDHPLFLQIDLDDTSYKSKLVHTQAHSGAGGGYFHDGSTWRTMRVSEVSWVWGCTRYNANP